MELSEKYLLAQEQTNQLLRNLTIVQLCLAGVSQREIRSIVGGDMNAISKVAKLVRKGARQPSAE